jgi:hypothetical protein
MSALDAFSAATFVVLDGAPGRPASVTIHEYVKGDVVKPYVVLGELTEGQRRTFARKGYEDTITIHAFSAAKGNAEVLGIVTWLTLTLEDRRLTLNNPLKASRLRLDSNNVFKDPDGIYHAVVRFRVIIQA